MQQRVVVLPNGTKLPALGIRLVEMGKDAGAFFGEADRIKAAYEMGYRFFDASQHSGSGGAEEILGYALGRERDNVILATKVSPDLLSSDDIYDSVITSCENSLRRMNTDYIDLLELYWTGYMTYWPEIIEAFVDLKADGKIKEFGVSHFDKQELTDWFSLSGTEQTAVVGMYVQQHINIEDLDVRKICNRRGIPIFSHGPSVFTQSIYEDEILKRIASDRGVSSLQIAFAWAFMYPNLGVWMRCLSNERNKEAIEAQNIKLSKDEIAMLESYFKKRAKENAK